MLDLVKFLVIIYARAPVIKKDRQLLIVVADVYNNSHIAIKYADAFIHDIAISGSAF